MRLSYGDFINSARKKRTKTTLLLYKSRLFGQNEQHSEFCYPKKKKKEKKKGKKEKRGGHIIKCLLTELGRAGRENIWHSVMAHRPRCDRSVRYDLGPNIFPSGPPTQSISTYYDTGSVNRRKSVLSLLHETNKHKYVSL